MAASTVTGRGYGASKGKYKPENNCGGCHCGCGKNCPPPIEPVKIGCYTRVRVGGKLVCMAPNAVVSNVVCS